MRVKILAGWVMGVLLCLALAYVAAGQGDRSKPDGGRGPAATVLRLEDDWTKALIRHDMPAMAAILAEGMVYTENDQTSDRESLLRDMATTKEKVTAARNTEMKAHVFGETIVVTGRLTVKGRGPEGDFDRNYRFTDVWMRPKGRWQIVAAQDYLNPGD